MADNAGMSGASLLSSLFTLLVKGINNVNIHSIFYFVSVIDFHVCTFKEDNFFYNTYHYNSIFNDVDFTKPQEFAPDYEMYSSFLQTFFSICAIFNKNAYVVLRPFGTKRRESALNEVTLTICQEKQLPTLDCTKFTDIDEMFYDGVHLTASGSLKFGSYLADIIHSIK